MKYKEALKKMISGETEAHHTYLTFSKQAATEGLMGIALLFKALSAAELIHIKNHKNALKEDFTPTNIECETPKTTLENLQAAIDGEREESKKLYPKLMKSIKDELNTLEGKVANLSLQWAMDAEKRHLNLLKKAFKAVSKGRVFTLTEVWICTVCGNIILPNETEKECDLCGHDTLFFKEMH